MPFLPNEDRFSLWASYRQGAMIQCFGLSTFAVPDPDRIKVGFEFKVFLREWVTLNRREPTVNYYLTQRWKYRFSKRVSAKWKKYTGSKFDIARQIPIWPPLTITLTANFKALFSKPINERKMFRLFNRLRQVWKKTCYKIVASNSEQDFLY